MRYNSRFSIPFAIDFLSIIVWMREIFAFCSKSTRGNTSINLWDRKLLVGGHSRLVTQFNVVSSHLNASIPPKSQSKRNKQKDTKNGFKQRELQANLHLRLRLAHGRFAPALRPRTPRHALRATSRHNRLDYKNVGTISSSCPQRQQFSSRNGLSTGKGEAFGKVGEI